MIRLLEPVFCWPFCLKGSYMLRSNLIIALCAIFLLSAMALPVFADTDLHSVKNAISAKNLKWSAGTPAFTKEQFRARLGILQSNSQDLPDPEPVILKVEEDELPTAYNWQDYNALSPVKHQGMCGSCWAFAAVAALESAAIRQGGHPQDINLSEQYLVSDCFWAASCDGSYANFTPVHFLVTDGTVPEDCVPYTQENSSCEACEGHEEQIVRAYKSGAIAMDVEEMKRAVYTYGPFVTAMLIFEDFNYYQSGIYSYSSGAMEGGHAVLIVGYNDEEQYFIVKNSWGPGWGENGYFKIAYSEVGGVSEFGQDNIWLEYDDGTQDRGTAPEISNLQLMDYYGTPYGPDPTVTPSESAYLTLAFDYFDEESDLEHGGMYFAMDGWGFLMGPLTGMDQAGTLGFSFYQQMPIGYHYGNIWLEDVCGNISNTINYGFTVANDDTDDDDDDDDDDDTDEQPEDDDDDSGSDSDDDDDDDENGCGL